VYRPSTTLSSCLPTKAETPRTTTAARARVGARPARLHRLSSENALKASARLDPACQVVPCAVRGAWASRSRAPARSSRRRADALVDPEARRASARDRRRRAVGEHAACAVGWRPVRSHGWRCRRHCGRVSWQTGRPAHGPLTHATALRRLRRDSVHRSGQERLPSRPQGYLRLLPNWGTYDTLFRTRSGIQEQHFITQLVSRGPDISNGATLVVAHNTTRFGSLPTVRSGASHIRR
jgi:hypothetical protein